MDTNELSSLPHPCLDQGFLHTRTKIYFNFYLHFYV